MEDAVFFGQRKVKASGESPSKHVWVEYEDGGREYMHEDEWLQKSAEPRNEDRDLVRARTESVVKEILEILKTHNVRLEDLGDIVMNVRDSIQLAINQSKEVAYGKSAQHMRLDDVQKVLDDGRELGKLPTFTGDVIRMVSGGLVNF